jgi:hypothetical protein
MRMLGSGNPTQTTGEENLAPTRVSAAIPLLSSTFYLLSSCWPQIVSRGLKPVDNHRNYLVVILCASCGSKVCTCVGGDATSKFYVLPSQFILATDTRLMAQTCEQPCVRKVWIPVGVYPSKCDVHRTKEGGDDNMRAAEKQPSFPRSRESSKNGPPGLCWSATSTFYVLRSTFAVSRGHLAEPVRILRGQS